MTPPEAIRAAYEILPARMQSRQATVQLLAIQQQEDPEQLRRQVGGPARGLWQFEKGGGVRGTLRHPSSRPHALKLCAALQADPVEQAVYAELEHNDILAAGFARLLLWTDPRPLPPVGEVAEGWALYLRVWRPGAAKRDSEGLRRKWSVSYAKALELARA